jgi:hypothetical protein
VKRQIKTILLYLSVILVLIFQIFIFPFIKAFLRLRHSFCQCPWTSSKHGGTINDTIGYQFGAKFKLVFCAKYDRGLDLGFWEILKPLKWTNITSFFLIWLKRSKDLLVRRQFSMVLDNRTNVNVEAWTHVNQYLHWTKHKLISIYPWWKTWSLDGPLPQLCPVIPTSNQDGHQAKNRKKGGWNFDCSLLL